MMGARPPAPRQNLVGAWLVVVCIFVFAMVMVGGATRLTDSGLSITQWDLAKGLVPPLSAERWAEEFALYRQTAEYQVQNRGMSLAEFQYIYGWEWAHRFLGKAIGLLFAAPFLYFALTGRLRGRFWPTLALFALGAAQGAVGWWMVTSGLAGRVDVSPVRLAVHLGMAFAILALALWLALDAFGWPRARSKLGAPNWAPALLLAVLFAQILLGAILAGADGGQAYADWPTIGGEYWPRGAFEGALTENHATQQLLHRSLGYLAGLIAAGLALTAALKGEGAARGSALLVGGLAALQVGLGVATLLTGSPLTPSLVHQANAALLWAAAVGLARAVTVR